MGWIDARVGTAVGNDRYRGMAFVPILVAAT